MSNKNGGKANKAFPVIPMELDKLRNLKLDLMALMLFEKETGRNALTDWEGFTLTELLTLCWLGLRWEDPELTLEYTVQILGDAAMDIAAMTMKLYEAADLAFPDPEPEVEADGEDGPNV